tara:strand:+ start:477 stop:1598 length:1122 start_codon:yes stop_codon:yes gene_type:complete
MTQLSPVDSSKELSIFDLIDLIINNIFIIVTLLVIGALAGIFFITNKEVIFKSELEIIPINESQMFQYEILNSKYNASMYSTNNDMSFFIEREEFINPEKLLNTFLNEFKKYLAFEEVISNSQIYNEIDPMLIAKNFKLVAPTNLKDQFDYYKITYETLEKDKVQNLSLVINVVDLINQEVGQQFIDMLAITIENQIKSQELQIASLQISLDSQKELIEISNNRKISNLQDQIEIAKTLDLAVPNTNILNDSIIFNNEYLRGYTALEKELEIVLRDKKNLMKNTDYYKAYQDLKNSKTDLLQLQNISNLEHNINVDQFKSVNIDKRLIKYEEGRTTSIIISSLIGGLLGMFVGILIGFIRFIYLSYKNEKNLI